MKNFLVGSLLLNAYLVFVAWSWSRTCDKIEMIYRRTLNSLVDQIGRDCLGKEDRESKRYACLWRLKCAVELYLKVRAPGRMRLVTDERARALDYVREAMRKVDEEA